jgi:hypothetical protein
MRWRRDGAIRTVEAGARPDHRPGVTMTKGTSMRMKHPAAAGALALVATRRPSFATVVQQSILSRATPNP